MPNVIERHQDYIIPIGALANGVIARPELNLDTDAPFCLRGIGAYKINDAGTLVTALTGGALQIVDAEQRNLETEMTDLDAETVVIGRGAQYSPIRPQRIFPPDSVISFNVRNDSGGAWASAFIVCRGVKLFYEGDVWSPTYRDCYREIPSSLPLAVTVAASTTLRDQSFQIGNDADFAWRGTSAISLPGAATDAQNLSFTLKDYLGKAFSNSPINWQWLFGLNAQRPGQWYPEIYIPRNQVFIYDVVNGQASQLQLALSLTGQKVFEK